MEVRSYRRVFDLERRIYRIDRLRLNPGGVPVKGVTYGLASLSAAVLATHLPLIGAVVGLLPWYLRYLAFPIAIGATLGVTRVDGRPFHLFALALLRQRTSARGRSRVGRRWLPDDIVILPDGSDGRMRRLQYRGPGVVLVAVAHDRGGWATRGAGSSVGRIRPALTLAESCDARAPQRREAICLDRGVRLRTRPRSSRAPQH